VTEVLVMQEEFYTIRLATTTDRESTQRISVDAYTKAYLPVIGAIPKPALEDYTPRIEAGQVFVIEKSDQVSGVLVLEPRDVYVLIYSVAVDPTVKNKGFGAALMRFAESYAKNINVRELRLFTNSRMHRNLEFYRRLGFVEIGTRAHPTRVGERLVDMSRILTL